MGIISNFLNHVERPDHVGIVRTGQLLVGRAVVLAVHEAFRIEAPDDARVAHVVDTFALNEG